MTPETKPLATAPTTPLRHHIEADSALRQIATVLADRTATTEQIMDALRDWSRIVVVRRDYVAGAQATAEARQASADGIVDVVSLSSAALTRRAS